LKIKVFAKIPLYVSTRNSNSIDIWCGGKIIKINMILPKFPPQIASPVEFGLSVKLVHV